MRQTRANLLRREDQQADGDEHAQQNERRARSGRHVHTIEQGSRSLDGFERIETSFVDHRAERPLHVVVVHQRG